MVAWGTSHPPIAHVRTASQCHKHLLSSPFAYEQPARNEALDRISNENDVSVFVAVIFRSQTF
jgi:hypothetical protein